MRATYDVIVVGAGIFGITAALEFNARHYRVALLDPGPLPHPLAASTDISKVVRMEYGADAEYMAMAEKAHAGWLQWNDEWDEALYHDVGVTMLTCAPMTAGSFEYESYQLLRQRGHTPVRLSRDDIARRFPAWKPGAYVDGFFHAQGGYAESGRVVETLINQARDKEVALHAGQTVAQIVEENGRITGVQTQEGEAFSAGQVVVAAGAWTPLLIPELAPVMRSVGQPVFHLKPADPSLFKPPHFTVFTADVANTGWYGFPLHPREGVVKIANHGTGQELHPTHDRRIVDDADVRRLRAFLTNTFPALQDATITYTRRCLYCDTLDEHLWIDRHPRRPGLTIAAGGSGHGFKFGPLLGQLIADAVEGKENHWLPKFRWRSLGADTDGEEAARFHG